MPVSNDKSFTLKSKALALDAAARKLTSAQWALATYLGDLDGHGHIENAVEPDAKTLGGLIRRAHLAAWRVAEASNPCRRVDGGESAIGRALEWLKPLAENCREALARWRELVDARTAEAVGHCHGMVQIDAYYTPEGRRIRRVADRCKYWPKDCEPTRRGMAEWIERRDARDRDELAAFAH